MREDNGVSCKAMHTANFKPVKMFKKVKDSEEHSDCLTILPEPLLHRILSYLTMKDVIRTSVLATRWRFIWLSVPCLKFSPLKMRRDREVSFINRTLLLHRGPSIQKFDLTFRHSHAETHYIDSWIDFAKSRNVNELYLDFLSQIPVRQLCWLRQSRQLPQLPRFVFSCRSLTVLTLKCCFIGSPVTFNLSSLKTLSLEVVDFSGEAINDLVFSSRMLEHFSLKNCQARENLELKILNVSVKTLKIHESSCSSSSKLEVYAPFVVSFELVTILSRKNYVIDRMQFLESARFGCSAHHFGGNCREDKGHFVANILGDLHHVKELRLCSCYFEALCFGEEKSLDCLSFDATCLAIKTGLSRGELPEIGYMLRHSPNINTLIISIDKVEAKTFNDSLEDDEYWKLQQPNSANLLCNLKDVKIYNFMKNLKVLERKPMSTTDDLLAHLQNDMNFLRFLLKNSKVMERMTIATFKEVKFGLNSESKKLKLLFQLTLELLTFPRASRAAQISFS